MALITLFAEWSQSVKIPTWSSKTCYYSELAMAEDLDWQLWTSRPCDVLMQRVWKHLASSGRMWWSLCVTLVASTLLIPAALLLGCRKTWGRTVCWRCLLMQHAIPTGRSPSGTKASLWSASGWQLTEDVLTAKTQVLFQPVLKADSWF